MPSLGADLKAPLFTLKLLGLKILKTSADTATNGTIQRTQVSLSAERVELSGL